MVEFADGALTVLTDFYVLPTDGKDVKYEIQLWEPVQELYLVHLCLVYLL